MVGLGAPIEALVGAAIAAFAQGDREPLAALFRRFGRLPFPARELRLLSALRAVLADEHRTFDEAFALLQADGNRAEELPALLDLLEAGRIVSSATFGQMLERVEAQSLAVEVGALAPRLLDGELSCEEFFARIDKERANIESTAKPSDFCRFQIVNDPEQEPPLETAEAWIDGVLVHGFTIGSGLPKVGKTWYWTHASMCIASGTEFLGRKVKQGRVCWVQADMGQALFRVYCEHLRVGMNIAPVAIPVTFDARLDLMKPEHQRALVARLETIKPEIVFIDSARAVASVRENESDDVQVLARKFILAELRDRLGISVVLIHHAAKSGTGSRGSGEWDAAADSCLTFTGGNGDPVTVRGRGRHSPIELAFTIEDHTLAGGGVVLRASQPGAGGGKRERGPDRRVEDHLRLQPSDRWLTISEVQTEAHVGFAFAKLELNRLFGRGLAEHDGGPERTRRWRFPPHCRLVATSRLSDSQPLPPEVGESESWASNGGQVV